jgi:TolA-binding protein
LFALEKWDEAVEGYSIFIDFNPESELLGEAYFEQGQAFASLERWTDAARSYLGAFSYDRESIIAPNALYYLGLSLDKIGQRQEACQTVNEVVVRYPDAPIISTAINQMQIMECS